MPITDADDVTVVRLVLEWTGDPKNAIRSAQIQLQYDQDHCCLVMMSHTKSILRVIDFLRHDKLLIWASSDKQRNYLLIHVPREYDLVSDQQAFDTVHLALQTTEMSMDWIHPWIGLDRIGSKSGKYFVDWIGSDDCYLQNHDDLNVFQQNRPSDYLHT